LCQGQDGKRFYVPYDKVIIAVGSRSITFGIKGVEEYTHFLKTINDVRKIRAKLLANFEKASLPTISETERQRLLTFVVCGGGPTGVEFAAEMYDLVTEDMAKYFPHLSDYVQVYIVQSQDHILNTYDLRISKYAQDK
jgi:NADH dehydrogenase